MSTLALCAFVAFKGSIAWGQPLPMYRLDVALDREAHTIAGSLEVALSTDDPRLSDALWFHLPPNRFAHEDPRGIRRSIDAPQFATRFGAPDPNYDPAWPDGYSPGNISIRSVETLDGRPLPFNFADNPALVQGFSIRDALMRVELGGHPGLTGLKIHFVTHLPERYEDGWSDAGVVLLSWHPVLAGYTADSWNFDPFEPSGGRYAIQVAVNRSGRLFLGHGWSRLMKANGVADVPMDPNPLRVFPLVFLDDTPSIVRHAYDVSVYSHYQEDHARLGELSIEIARRFLRHVRHEFGLPAPNERIAIVEVDLPPGDIRTVGSIVLVPRDYYINSPLLDRVFVAQLSRAIAQVWFGETVWSHRDLQHWLHLGVSGFLALDFFRVQFGEDEGIHTVLDWLQPRYREHYFEEPVRSLMRGERDAPLILSLHRYSPRRSALVVAHNKAPLVLRSLRYVVGDEAFARALNVLFHRYRYSVVNEAVLQRELEAESDADVAAFIDQWFRSAPAVDFAVESWDQDPVPSGFRVRARVRRTEGLLLPVDVRVTTEEGERVTRRWPAGEAASEITFVVGNEAAGVSIDPEERWLELERKDNYSALNLRIRPIYDWPKQRDVLVALTGTAGGNSVDGNYAGLGANVSLNENNSLRVIPIYGERTGWDSYLASWYWQRAAGPDFDLEMNFLQLGGATSQSVGGTYRFIDTDNYLLAQSLHLQAETVTRQQFVYRDGSAIFHDEERSNGFALTTLFSRRGGEIYGAEVMLESLESRPSYGSAFEFNSHALSIEQTFYLGAWHRIDLTLARRGITGVSPVQKRHLIGGPGALRGYPRTVELTHQELALGALDYGWIVSRAPIGSSAQIRRTTLFLFTDAGRGWDNDEHHDTYPSRRDVGIGFELRIDLLRLTEFPVRVDIAYPIDDDEYEDPQLILFGLLSF